MTAIAYLSGYGEYEDLVEHVRFGSNTEYYVDDRKAIMRVAIFQDGTFTHWEEKAFPTPDQRYMMRHLIAFHRLGGGVTDLGDARIEIDQQHPCPQCDGFGTVIDMDGDGMQCTWCDGQGWY